MTTAIGAYATASALKTRIAISDTTDDTTLSNVCDQVNQYVETKTGRVLGRSRPPSSCSTATARASCATLAIRAVSLLECAEYTERPLYGRGVAVLPAPRPRRPPSRLAVHPLEFTDIATGTFTSFPRGFDTVRMTATTGWTAIPDDITELALVAATRAWHAVESGQQDIVGTDDMAGRSSRGSSRRAIRDPARLRRGPARMTTRPSTFGHLHRSRGRFVAATIGTPTGAGAMRALRQAAQERRPPPPICGDQRRLGGRQPGPVEHEMNIDGLLLLAKRPADPERVEAQRQLWLPTCSMRASTS